MRERTLRRAALRKADKAERRLPISREQAALLANIEAAVQAALEKRNTVVATILAGSGIAKADLLGVSTDPPALILKNVVASHGKHPADG